MKSKHQSDDLIITYNDPIKLGKLLEDIRLSKALRLQPIKIIRLIDKTYTDFDQGESLYSELKALNSAVQSLNCKIEVAYKPPNQNRPKIAG